LKKQHNGIISFWKFIYSLVIIIFHARVFSDPTTKIVLFSKGSIAVEFFFIVSGYLLAKSALKTKLKENESLGKETLQFIFKKIKTFYPYIFMFYILTLIVTIIFEKLSLGKIISSVWNLLLLNIAGFKGIEINGVIWYISAMLICMLILYPLIKKYRYNFIYIISPLIIILLGGYLNHNFNSLRTPYLWIGFANKVLLRAFLELNLGIILYPISIYLSKINFSKFGKIIITITSNICFMIPLFINHFLQNASKYDYIILIILSISILLAFSTQTLDYKIMNNKISYFLEKLSLPMYLSHIFIRIVIINCEFLKKYSYNIKLLIFIVLTLIISYMSLRLVEFLKNKKIISNIFQKLFLNSKGEKDEIYKCI